MLKACSGAGRGSVADTLAESVRRRDPDRYFTALFAPAAARDTLLTLYAFNHELARAPEAAREPGLALIRLQWWREVVEGSPRAHEVAVPLHAALAAGRLRPDELLAMIDARELEAEASIADIAAWRDWLMLGPGSLCVAAGRALGAPEAAFDQLASLGAGVGAAGQLRNITAFARQGRCLLPSDVLADHGLTPDGIAADPTQPGLEAVRAVLADAGRALLGPPRDCGRRWVAAALPAVLARRDLASRSPDDRPRTTADRLAIVAGAMRARA